MDVSRAAERAEAEHRAATVRALCCLHDLAAPSVWGERDALNHRSAAVMRAAGMTPIEASAGGDLAFAPTVHGARPRDSTDPPERNKDLAETIHQALIEAELSSVMGACPHPG